MLTIGIDFGTTNCSAAVSRAGQVELIPLEDGSTILPSTICITRDGEVLVGRKAIVRFLELTRHATIRYRFTDLRRLTSVFSDDLDEPVVRSDDSLVVVSTAGEEEDLDRPARLFQSLKTGLRDPSFQGTTVYDTYYAMEDLIAIVLRHIRCSAEAYLGKPVRAAVIGRPVSYVGPEDMVVDPETVDETAHERMLAAARIAGFEQAALLLEPAAAARHLRASHEPWRHALVFDFGGGTLDLAVARAISETEQEIVAAHGVPLGGDDFDSTIMQRFLLGFFGAGTTFGPKHLPFPPSMLEPLLHWQTIPQLTMPANAARLAALVRESDAPLAMRNLQALIRKGLGFRLFQEIERAKIELSDEDQTIVRLSDLDLEIERRISRAEFSRALVDHLSTIEVAIRAVLQEARLEPSQIDRVMMTGGSSLVPVVQATVRRVFAGARVRVADPFTSIAAGLGIAAAEDDLCRPVTDVFSRATQERIRAEAVTIGETVAFKRGSQTVEGVVVRRAGGRLHDAVLVIEFWDPDSEAFVSTMRHETKVTRIQVHTNSRSKGGTDATVG